MAQFPINGLDLAVAVVLLISALLACMRGFVQETLSIGAWVGASFGSLYGLPYVQPTARRLIPLDWAADTAAVVVLFLAILFVLSLIINMLAGQVKRSGFNPLDRSLGFVFGLLRGAVILCVALIICDWLVSPDKRPEWMRTARTMPAMEVGAEALKSLLPRSFQRTGDTAKDARARVDEALETKRTLERLTQPMPRNARGKAAEGETEKSPRADEIGKKMEELLGNSGSGAGNESLLKRVEEMVQSGAIKPETVDPETRKTVEEMLRKRGIDPSAAGGANTDEIAKKVDELLKKNAAKSGASP